MPKAKQAKARKAGRPPLPRGEAKLGTLRVRVNPNELLSIEAKARRARQSVSEWIRSTLNAAIN
jgi:predicted HicB family RNase H-like nuclease